jgi:hypothetical protein
MDCRVCVGCRQFDGVPGTPTRYTVPLPGTTQTSMRSSCFVDAGAELVCWAPAPTIGIVAASIAMAIGRMIL